MATNNSNIHPDYDPNIMIKSEPDTVSESAASTTPSIPNLLQAIKTEPGLTSATKTTIRLASIIPPRDLRLGGTIKLEKPKKVYTPNLNAQRIKNREEFNISNKSDPNPKTKGRGRGDRGKNDRGRDKGKGRGKAASNLVQSAGIFSEGLGDISTKRYSGSSFRDRESSGGGRESSATLERPKLSIPKKIDKVEEAEKLRELLRDDFIDDGLDEDLDNTPVALPMINEAQLFKTESNQKLNASNENNKSVTLQNGDTKASFKIKPIVPQIKTKREKVSLTVPQVMENKSSTFILVQLPDCLPGLKSDDKQTDSKIKKTPEPSTENETDKSNKFCSLNNLKEGMLGKIQILRSGKAQLVLGENDLIVDVGSNLSFRQDLIAAKISDDKKSGDLVNLGPVNSTLICSPDWENMLKKLL